MEPEQATPEELVADGGRETRMQKRLKQASIKAESEEAEDEVADDSGSDDEDDDDVVEVSSKLRALRLIDCDVQAPIKLML